MISPYPAINAELSSKEKLLWSGQPKHGLLFNSHDLYLIPFFSIFLILGLVFLLAGEENINNESGLPFVVVPLTFTVIGAYLSFGRLIQGSWRRKKTFYGLTDRRVIIIARSGIKSIAVSSTVEMNFKAHRKSRASITFGQSISPLSVLGNQQFGLGVGEPMAPTFESIKDGEKVYKLIKEQIGI